MNVPQAQFTDRIDRLLVQLGKADSRQQAQRLVEEGAVQAFVAGREIKITKPSQLLVFNDLREILIQILPNQTLLYVSRGGLKLDGAIRRVGLNIQGLSCLDVGQSTGGFTDCLIKGGAKRVVGIDSGQGQLHDSLKRHPAVISFEKFKVHEEILEKLLHSNGDQPFDLIVVDVSFISLEKVLPHLQPLLKADTQLLGLVKPQFELSAPHLDKRGIVKDPLDYLGVRKKIQNLCQNIGWVVLDYFESPILGGDGNKEFFVYAAQALHAYDSPIGRMSKS